MPSATLLGQSVLSGIFIGSLYGLLGLGLSLSWGMLRQVNLAHFALAFLGGYLTFQLSGRLDPFVTLAVVTPLFFLAGMGLHWFLTRFSVSLLNTLLVTFGLTSIIEAGIQWTWTADFHRMENAYAAVRWKIGPLFVSLPDLFTLGFALVLSLGAWAVLRFTDLGKAIRATTEDAPIAAAFGVNEKLLGYLVSGLAAAVAAVAGLCLALNHTLAPAQIYAWMGVVFAAVMMGGLGRPIGPLVAGIVIGVSEALTMAVTNPTWAPLVSFSLLIVLLLFPAGEILMRIAIALIAAALIALPYLGLPAFYESFGYLLLSATVLATSWNVLSGYSGYFSFGHGAFFGVGVYTTAALAGKLGWNFMWTLPLAALAATLLGVALGAIVFRVRALRGELFALLTLAITFVLATIALNAVDGGPGIMVSVELPKIAPTAPGVIYLMMLAAAALTLWTAYAMYHSRFGTGLFAIHDDEDVAEVMGVPTYRFKLAAFAISCALAGLAGGIHAIFVSYVTVAETFSIALAVNVVLMSALGGTRHWLGPAVGAIAITVLLYAFTSGNAAVAGRALTGLILIVVIVAMPAGILGQILKRFRREPPARPRPEQILAGLHHEKKSGAPLLVVRGVAKAFKGVQALASVDLEVRRGEILGLVGPNGSGKSTLINVVSGHYATDAGSIRFEGEELVGRPAHRIARAGIARTYQIPRPFPQLTVLQNVALPPMFGQVVMDRARAEAEAWRWLAFTGLDAKAHRFPADLNLHERKFLELARALASRPKLLFLDEVLSGLTPAEMDDALRLIRAIRDQGATIVFVEHVMRAVMELTDRVAVLTYGKAIAEGAPAEVMRHPAVVSAYLGAAHV